MTSFNNNVSYKHSSAFRTVFYGRFMLILLTAFLALVIFSGSANADSKYIIENVEVDVTAKNAVEARTKAFEEAQIKGYQMLAETLLSEEELATLETPTIDTVSMYVQDYEVTNEKLSAVRYKGTYTFRFSPRAFSSMMASNDIEQTQETQAQQAMASGSVMVLPFYEVAAGQRVLWRDPNPFMQAWQRYMRRNAGAPTNVIVPNGNPNDRQQIGDNQSVNYNPAYLNAMRIRYRADNTKLLVAQPQTLSNGNEGLLVTVFEPQSWGPELHRRINVKGRYGEGTVQFYDRAVLEVANTIRSGNATAQQQQINHNTNINSGVKNSIQAILNFSSVQEWVRTKATLDRAQSVNFVRVQSLSPQQAMLEIDFLGDVEQLRESLRLSGVNMMEDSGLYYAQNQYGSAPVYKLSTARQTDY